jgi:hypothetical protein
MLQHAAPVGDLAWTQEARRRVWPVCQTSALVCMKIPFTAVLNQVDHDGRPKSPAVPGHEAQHRRRV